MESVEDFFKISIKILFYLIIPAAIVYFRIKKKINTGFAAGMIITSLLLGLIGVASVREDPVEKFIRIINSGREAESRDALKQVVQLGDEVFLRIDERKISDMNLYGKLKADLVTEYHSIAEKVFSQNKAVEYKGCESLKSMEYLLDSLRHSGRLTVFAEMLGGANPGLKKEIDSTVAATEKKFNALMKECEKN